MADLLAQVGDLSDLVGEQLDPDLETMLLELATAAVQAAAGQRLVEVTDDVVELAGKAESVIQLPERPVTSVASVEINGHPVTDFALRGFRLWRPHGWVGANLLNLVTSHVPTAVTVTYTHGYPDGHQELQFARQATLVAAARLHANPAGATGLSIDDYREQYSQAAGESGGEVPRSLQRALRRRYGLRLGMVTAQ